MTTVTTTAKEVTKKAAKRAAKKTTVTMTRRKRLRGHQRFQSLTILSPTDSSWEWKMPATGTPTTKLTRSSASSPSGRTSSGKTRPTTTTNSVSTGTKTRRKRPILPSTRCRRLNASTPTKPQLNSGVPVQKSGSKWATRRCPHGKTSASERIQTLFNFNQKKGDNFVANYYGKLHILVMLCYATCSTSTVHYLYMLLFKRTHTYLLIVFIY